MPEVGRTDGGSLRFYIYSNEHGTPHVHVRYGGVWAKVAISQREQQFLAGELTGRQRRLVARHGLMTIEMICSTLGTERNVANIPAKSSE